jgi:hypothetical protein
MVEHRLRLSDGQLNFIIQCLRELDEGYDELLIAYRDLRKKHKDDIVRTEYDKASKAFTETARKSIAVKDTIRRLDSVVKGGRPRVKDMANLAMAMVAEKRTPEAMA